MIVIYFVDDGVSFGFIVGPVNWFKECISFGVDFSLTHPIYYKINK